MCCRCKQNNSLFSSAHPLDFNMFNLVIFSSEKDKINEATTATYLYACWMMHMRHHH